MEANEKPSELSADILVAEIIKTELLSREIELNAQVCINNHSLKFRELDVTVSYSSLGLASQTFKGYFPSGLKVFSERSDNRNTQPYTLCSRQCV